jgi:hypothetical protein
MRKVRKTFLLERRYPAACGEVFHSRRVRHSEKKRRVLKKTARCAIIIIHGYGYDTFQSASIDEGQVPLLSVREECVDLTAATSPRAFLLKRRQANSVAAGQWLPSTGKAFTVTGHKSVLSGNVSQFHLCRVDMSFARAYRDSVHKRIMRRRAV